MRANGLRPYPAYRDSGVEWLGKVPEHWEVRRLKTMVSNTVDPTHSRKSGQFCLGLENVESWTGRIRLPDDAAGFDSQLKSFRAGDILFGKLRPYLAKVTRPERDGACVGEFLVLRPQHSDVIPSYTELVLRSRTVIEGVSGSTFGAKMPRADWMFLGGMHIPRPPLPEQTAIARYLEAADRRIRRYIRAKERLVELLEERKRALIHEAVTGRIDVRTGQPYPAYKDSGVEWLGKVPEHWAVLPGRACFVEKPKEPNLGLRETTVLSLSYGRIVVKPPEKLHGLVPASFETYQVVDPLDIVVRPTDLQNDRNSLRFGLSRFRGIITSAYMCLQTNGRLVRQLVRHRN